MKIRIRINEKSGLTLSLGPSISKGVNNIEASHFSASGSPTWRTKFEPATSARFSPLLLSTDIVLGRELNVRLQTINKRKME